MCDPEAVLDFWFGRLREGDAVPPERFRLWFGGEARTDRLIAERFAGAVDRAAVGKCEQWRATPRGTLALLLVLDQFPRNIYRGSARAYGLDPMARAICLEGLEAGLDRRMQTVERAFFYLPLEHAEDPRLQERSVAAFSGLLQEAPEPLREMCRGFLDYALRHRAIILRFGRFPHRNAVLGRRSSPEEEAFLRQPGSTF